MNIFVNKKLNFTNQNTSVPNVEQNEFVVSKMSERVPVGNPFQDLSADVFQKQEPVQQETETNPEEIVSDALSRRINDTDSNILNKNLVQYLPTESLRIEIQLEQKEEELSQVSKQLQEYKLLELDKNSEKFKELGLKQAKLAQEIQKHKLQYRAIGFIYKISDTCSDISLKVKANIQAVGERINNNSIIKKLKNIIPALKEREEISLTLKKFNAVQSNVSDYLNGKNPFGEIDRNTSEFVGLMAAYNKLGISAEKIKKPDNDSNTATTNLFSKAFCCVSNLWNNFKDFIKFNKDMDEKEN